MSAILTATATMAMAHEHHEDEIPDGSAISAEPLVSCSRALSEIVGAEGGLIRLDGADGL